jgi:ATP-dependent DNA helicase DinG
MMHATRSPRWRGRRSTLCHESFWEGVDIAGPAFSLVIIDKLPFSPYRDPVVQYRQQAISDRGGRPFDEMTLPEAILALKQGVGRLIRTEAD